MASIASVVLPIAIDQVLQQWPNLRAQIIEGVWDRLADALIKREIDLALSIAADDTDEICAIGDCQCSVTKLRRTFHQLMWMRRPFEE